MNRKYEAMFLIRLKLRQQDIVTGQEDPNPESVVEYIKSTIIDNGGEILEDEIWDRRRQLAYEIDHEREAMYYRIVVNMPASNVNKVRDIFRRNNRILRFIFFVLNDKKADVTGE